LGSRIGNAQGVEKAVPIDRQSALAHNHLGLRFAAEGKLELAEKEFKTALAIDPAFAEAQNNLGVLYGEQGKKDAAESSRMVSRGSECMWGLSHTK
jgi:Tfp pilus assembly protein PilF